MDQIRVILTDDTTPITVPEKAVNCMEQLKVLQTVSQGNIKLPIRKSVFEKILQFLHLNNYGPVKTAVVTTNNLSQALIGEEKIVKFLQSFKNDTNKAYSIDMAELFKAASHLQCKYLTNLIGFYISTVLYFEDNSTSYNQMKNRLGFKEDLTIGDEERYALTYR